MLHPKGRLNRDWNPVQMTNSWAPWGVGCGNWPVIIHYTVVGLYWMLSLLFSYLPNPSVKIKSAGCVMFVMESTFNKPAIAKPSCPCTSRRNIFLFLSWGAGGKSMELEELLEGGFSTKKRKITETISYQAHDVCILCLLHLSLKTYQLPKSISGAVIYC